MPCVRPQGLWAYKYWKLDETLQEYAEELYLYVFDMLTAEIAQVRDLLINLNRSRIISFDPEKGVIQFELYLPHKADFLYELPQINTDQITKYFRKLQSLGALSLPTGDFCMWDLYYKYKPSHPATWVPPFKGNI
jgi:hypothetical protein